MPERTSSFYDPNGTTRATSADEFGMRDNLMRRQAQSQDAELRARLQDAAANRALQLQMGGSFADRSAADTHQTGMRINRDVDLARLQNQGNIATQGTFDQQRMARQAELAQAGGLQADDRTARLAHESSMQGMRGEQAMGLDRQQGESRLANTRLGLEPVNARLAQDRIASDREWTAGEPQRYAANEEAELIGSLFRRMGPNGSPMNPQDKMLMDTLLRLKGRPVDTYPRDRADKLADENRAALRDTQKIAYQAAIEKGDFARAQEIATEMISDAPGKGFSPAMASAFTPTAIQTDQQEGDRAAAAVKTFAFTNGIETLKRKAAEIRVSGGDPQELAVLANGIKNQLQKMGVPEARAKELIRAQLNKDLPGVGSDVFNALLMVPSLGQGSADGFGSATANRSALRPGGFVD